MAPPMQAIPALVSEKLVAATVVRLFYTDSDHSFLTLAVVVSVCSEVNTEDSASGTPCHRYSIDSRDPV